MTSKIDPATIMGMHFRLAAVEIEDTAGYDGARSVKVFARFCALDSDINDPEALLPVRLSTGDLMDMMGTRKQRWFWQRQPEIPTIETASIFNDMSRSHKLPDLIHILGQAQVDYLTDLAKPKLVVKSISDLTRHP